MRRKAQHQANTRRRRAVCQAGLARRGPGIQASDRQGPTNGRAWFRLGSVLYRTGDYAGARAAFQHAVENNFQAPYAMAGIARSYAAEKQPAKAIEELQKSADAWLLPFAGFITGDEVFTRDQRPAGYEKAVRLIARNGQPGSFQTRVWSIRFLGGGMGCRGKAEKSPRTAAFRNRRRSRNPGKLDAVWRH